MKTLREMMDLVETVQIDPFNLLTNQDLLSVSQALNSVVREESSDRDQTIDEIISKLSDTQKKLLKSKLDQEIKQRKANPASTQTIKPAKSSMLAKIIASIIIGGPILYATTKDENPTAQVQQIPKHKQVEVVKFNWRVGGFDNILMVDFEIKNNLSTPVKDIKIVCNSYAKSGTKIDSNVREIFDIIQPGQVLRIGNFNMGFINSQVHQVGCVVKDFQLVNKVNEDNENIDKASDDAIKRIEQLVQYK